MRDSGDEAADSALLGQVRDLLTAYKAMPEGPAGRLPVYLKLQGGGSETVLRLPDEWRVPGMFAVVSGLGAALGGQGSAEIPQLEMSSGNGDGHAGGNEIATPAGAGSAAAGGG